MIYRIFVDLNRLKTSQNIFMNQEDILMNWFCRYRHILTNITVNLNWNFNILVIIKAVNTFVSERLHDHEKQMGYFVLKMHQNWHMSLSMILVKSFLFKMLYKNLCVNFYAFSRQNGSFTFFLKIEPLRGESVIKCQYNQSKNSLK